MSEAWAYQLSLAPWRVFGHLTFPDLKHTSRQRYGAAWGLLRAFAHDFGLPYSRLSIALRSETGERFGRPHFHFLLGGSFRTMSASRWLSAWWWNHVGGRRDVQGYDVRLSGAAYVCKCLGYELSKFGLAGLFISEATFRALRRSCGKLRNDRATVANCCSTMGAEVTPGPGWGISCEATGQDLSERGKIGCCGASETLDGPVPL